jgi:flagellar biosynthesis protein FliQ
VRRLGLPWPHLFLLLLVGLLYGLALALMGDVPPHVTLPFVPVIIVYLIKLSRLGA